MTLPQIFAFAIVLGMMALFAWGRIRYDLVALLALLAGLLTGIVPAEKAFTGFGDDIVIIVASALLVSAAVARSGVIEDLLRKVSPYLTSTRMMVVVLAGTVTALSGFVKNIGALAMLMPVAFQLARRRDTSPSYLLMPMAFGSLLGGLVTLVGTSPNIIVARMRGDILGEPFHMFDFAPVGIGLSVAGLVFLAFGYRLLPANRKGAASLDSAINLEGYITEVRVPEDSPIVGQTVGDLETLADKEVEVSTIIRERFRRYAPSANWTLHAGDLLLLQGEPDALERAVAQAKLRLAAADEEPDLLDSDADNIGVVEAVVTGDSELVDRSPAGTALTARYQVRLLAVSRSGERITSRLRTVRFRPGDVIVLQGDLGTLPDVLAELRCLPLAEREIRLGKTRKGYVPISILAVAMLLVAFGLVPVASAFFGASVIILLVRALSLKEAYEVIDWPILVLIGALIPVSDAMRTTGATDLIAGWLSIAAGALPPHGALALILVTAMAVTPFLNNAATVLVMAPIGAQLAHQLGYRPDAFLMAVAIGAGCDFLTPIGHQCNTLVMGAGGYRFGDYWKLGLPLSIMVVIIGVPLIAFFWPLAPR
ncbi:SLC13 family permease [Propylenella binzhouense]|uniref:SLC13 family permease n=1 Tax=Propylenella binzhouense TaxID=2555902 RepID=A0A964T1S8_9HYPH|nr:SLC13 family permease [Propylenella binzhouense]MYZ46690.1 SLC13 family permease [Propylenella binzhouense]